MSTTDENYQAKASESAERFTEQAEEYTRQEPTKALGIAFVVGLVLTLLPIGSIVGGLVRLVLGLVRPALVVLGAVKLYEEINSRQQQP